MNTRAAVRRRTLLRAVGVAAAAGTAGCSAVRELAGRPPPTPEDVEIDDATWSQAGHDQRNSRRTDRPLLDDSGPLEEQWRFTDVGLGGRRAVTDDSHAYVVAKAPGSELVALDHATGRVEWRRPASALAEEDGAGLYSAPAGAAADTVFAVATVGRSNPLVAVDAASGAVTWRLPAKQVRDVVVESGGSLLVADRERSHGADRVRRVDLRSGDVLWEYRTPSRGEVDARVHDRMAVGEDAVSVPVYFPSADDGEIHVLDKATGELRTVVSLESWVSRGLVVHDGLLVGAFRDHPEEGYALFAVDPDGGEWLLPSEGPVSGIATTDDRVVYSEHSTHVVDPTGPRRVRSTDASAGDAPLVAGSRFLTSDGRALYGHDVESGVRVTVYGFDAETELETAVASKGYLLLSARQAGRGWAVIALGR